MRLFPPAETVSSADIVSVNGVGDTLIGVLIANLAKEDDSPDQRIARVEDHIVTAQKAAVLTLKSKEAVSPDIKSVASPVLKRELA